MDALVFVILFLAISSISFIVIRTSAWAPVRDAVLRFFRRRRSEPDVRAAMAEAATSTLNDLVGEAFSLQDAMEIKARWDELNYRRSIQLPVDCEPGAETELNIRKWKSDIPEVEFQRAYEGRPFLSLDLGDVPIPVPLDADTVFVPRWMQPGLADGMGAVEVMAIAGNPGGLVPGSYAGLRVVVSEFVPDDEIWFVNPGRLSDAVRISVVEVG